jgi:predicted Na+-dependent transporter
MFASPILLGMILRTVFRKASDNLLSILGGAAILLVLSIISNSYSDTNNFFASQVLAFRGSFLP